MTGYQRADATVSARDAVVVTKGDTAAADIPTTRALYVNGAGDVKVVMHSGNEATFTMGGAGVLPVQVRRVFATGTTVTGDVLALY